MSNSIKTDELASKVVELLNEYNDEITDAIADASNEFASQGVETLRGTTQPSASSNGGGGNYKPVARRTWDKYAKGWTYKDTSEKAYGFVRNTIYNKGHYQLTHLLEYGHATQTGGHTRAFAHIKPVEEELTKKYEDRVKEIIKKGGK